MDGLSEIYAQRQCEALERIADALETWNRIWQTAIDRPITINQTPTPNDEHSS